MQKTPFWGVISCILARFLNQLKIILEAPAGFEPAIKVLQTFALATWLWSHINNLNYYIKNIVKKQSNFELLEMIIVHNHYMFKQPKNKPKPSFDYKTWFPNLNLLFRNFVNKAILKYTTDPRIKNNII